MKQSYKAEPNPVDANDNFLRVSRELRPTNGPHMKEKILLTEDQVMSEFREPFIRSGYRKPYLSVKECILSLFQPTNETFNFYSSSLFALVFMDFFLVAFSKLNIMDHYSFPFVVCAISTLIFCFVSAAAHLFNALSIRARHICFYCDYAALSIYSMGAGLTFYFYSRPVDGDEYWLFSSPVQFLGVSFLFSCMITICCCKTRLHWLSYRYVIRSFVFFVPFVYNSSPFLVRNIVCRQGLDCNPEGLFYLNLNFLFYILAGVLNAVRLPERLAPGEFDVFGNSHHYLHVIGSTAALCHLMGIEAEMSRRPIVDIHHMANFWDTLGLLVLTIAMNIVIVIWFAVHTPSEEELIARRKQE